MDREIVYAGSIPLDTDILTAQKFAMIGIAWAVQAALGTSTLVSGLGCVPTGPASLQVVVNPGVIYTQGNTDGSTFGGLAADSHQIMKQGILADAATLSCPAPGTAGQSINYLIEAQFQEVDGTPVVLPYYNASNPATAWSGPNNTGTAQNTVRKASCAVQVKAGAAATTGSQVTPAADAGWTGLWVVTVANGQSTITAGNIAALAGAPFISETLTQKISQTTGDARYAPISTVGLKPGTLLMWPTPVCPSWALTRDGSAISRASAPNLFAALCPTRNGTFTSGNATVTGLSSTTDLYIGMPIEGANISAGTTIASIPSATSITMSAVASGNGTAAITLFYYGYGSGGSGSTFGVPDDRGQFERGLDTAGTFDQSVQAGTTANGVATITGLSSTKGLFVGMAVSGTNIPGGRTIASIDSLTQVTMSGTATGVAGTVTFAGRMIGQSEADDIRAHTHGPGSYASQGGAGGGGSFPVINTSSSTASDAIIGTSGSTGNAETRPRNRAYLPIIVF